MTSHVAARTCLHYYREPEVPGGYRVVLGCDRPASEATIGLVHPLAADRWRAWLGTTFAGDWPTRRAAAERLRQLATT